MSSEPIQEKIKNLWGNEYVLLGSLKEESIGYAKAIQEYIPIKEFKDAFLKASELADAHDWEAFVFDKSNLTVFHQPSMEWYYTEWKKDLAKNGLRQHYKILPEQEYFKSSVEAGIVDIKRKFPDFDFDAFDVDYINSLEEL